ncbi:MAG: hypothetical protein A2653_03040 [Candidatus Zambryskibacteria bacterium RIFCSPHIGHO2_01_FULL_43_25]|uniref:Uncharacterized protein n=1 Tax=Candidatus Zambryskibacteria bacterium RIFCSPLOWO2_01_FULL_45_21 TaxID=1802761 RepID=A0A1G2U2G8_9BACT|nr:MAG: hypothetical protein A2653_03040 [Candidatus Zambryskibacteria bacterium RIFCSPHIGHO2_01_FULL_43_25]OHB00999.1 MAG: hypothetical protein A3E94_02305 [Candidatus Zambryskibacteria bacterium RIFCSPHIGHO2_12_FULL_44_12b]OHB03717.1 MAG: hypothetical protein A3B14_01580 [Candidatus Zambryskibacteria bacterium RIFCSPLOWO2_01_FULL_45_21]
MKERFFNIGAVLFFGFLFWSASEAGYQQEAKRCITNWGNWGQDVRQTEVWFGCEGSVFKRKFASFEMLSGWAVDSIVHHQPEGGYGRGTTVHLFLR